MTINPTPTPADRQTRINEILDGAIVRRCLGQGALYCRLAGGEHEVTFGGRRFTGATLREAVDLCVWARDHQRAGE
jgi:hypothetical protein